eukprot:365950-Chlamydomonas_euryale.AAC.1
MVNVPNMTMSMSSSCCANALLPCKRRAKAVADANDVAARNVNAAAISTRRRTSGSIDVPAPSLAVPQRQPALSQHGPQRAP